VLVNLQNLQLKPDASPTRDGHRLCVCAVIAVMCVQCSSRTLCSSGGSVASVLRYLASLAVMVLASDSRHVRCDVRWHNSSDVMHVHIAVGVIANPYYEQQLLTISL